MEGLFLQESALMDASELFGEEATTEPQPAENNAEPTPPANNAEEGTQETSTTEVRTTAEELFGGEEKPESVGGEEDNKGAGGPSSNGDGTSPQNDVISSFAKAMKDDGYLQNLDEDTLAGIKDAQSMADAIEKEVLGRLDAEQRRIKEALDMGVPAESVKNYNTILGNLGKITEEQLNAESEHGQNLRVNLIYQDFINKGIPEEQAKVLVKRSVDAGTDREDAKSALEGNKTFYQNQYDKLINDAKAEEAAEKQKIEKQAADLKKSLLESKEVFKGISLDDATRKKAYEAVTKPIARSTDGENLTAVQKFADDNPVEFRKALGVLFTLTNGFTSLDGVINKQVRKQVKSHLSSFEAKMNSRPSGGGLAYAEGDRGGGTDMLSNGGWLLDTGK